MPRTALSLDAVVEEACCLVDRDGWRQLTMTVLARRLGVQGPSLYHHVGGVDAVLTEVQLRAVRDMADAFQRNAMGRVGPDCLRALARALDAYAFEHPGLYDLAYSAPFDAARVHDASEPSRSALAAVIASFGIASSSVDLQLMCLAPLHGVLALTLSGTVQRHEQHERIYHRMTELVIGLLEREGQS